MNALESKSMAYELHRPVPAGGSHGLEENKNPGVHTGTGQDAVDMARLGRKQEFKRNFHSWAVVGLSSVIMATWVALLGSASFSLIDGGYAGTVYTYIAVWLLTIPVTLSLAEMVRWSQIEFTNGRKWLINNFETADLYVRQSLSLQSIPANAEEGRLPAVDNMYVFASHASVTQAYNC